MGVVAEGAHGQHPPGRTRRRHRCPRHQRGWVWLPGLGGSQVAAAAAGAAGGGARKALERRSMVAAKAKPPNVCKRTSCAAAVKYPLAAASARQAHPKCAAVRGGSPAAAWRKAALAAWAPVAGCWAMLEWSFSNATGAAVAKWWQPTRGRGGLRSRRQLLGWLDRLQLRAAKVHITSYSAATGWGAAAPAGGRWVQGCAADWGRCRGPLALPRCSCRAVRLGGTGWRGGC